jgi:hypothetical protein
MSQATSGPSCDATAVCLDSTAWVALQLAAAEGPQVIVLALDGSCRHDMQLNVPGLPKLRLLGV